MKSLTVDWAFQGKEVIFERCDYKVMRLILLLIICLLSARTAFAADTVPADTDSILREAEAAFYTDVAHALQLSQRALQQAQKEENRMHQARSYVLLGKLYHFYGLRAQALEYKKKASEIASELSDLRFYADCLNSVGVSWRSLKQTTEARNHYLQAFQLNDSLHDTLGICKNLANLGLVAKDDGDLAEAESKLQESLKLSRKIKFAAGVAINLVNLGNINEQSGRFEEAERLYREGLATANASNNQQVQLSIHYRLAHFFLSMKRLQEGEQHLAIAQDMAKALGAQKLGVSLQQLKAQYATAKGLWREAIKEYEEYTRLDDEFTKQDDSIRYANLNQLFQADEYLRKNELLQARLSVHEKELKLAKVRDEQHKLILMGGGIVLILLLIFSLILSKLYVSKQRANYHLNLLAAEVNEQKEALAAANEAIRKQNEVLEQQVAQRTDQLKKQNYQLRQFAFFNAHKVRGPLARILGLLNLFELDTSSLQQSEVVNRLRMSGQEMDDVLREISELLDERPETF